MSDAIRARMNSMDLDDLACGHIYDAALRAVLDAADQSEAKCGYTGKRRCDPYCECGRDEIWVTRLRHLIADALGVDLHATKCCAWHNAHSTPHVGCILR